MNHKLTERVERVIEDHQWLFEIDQCSCGCEWFVEGGTDNSTCYDNHLALKIIEALDLGTPCAATGCRMRKLLVHPDCPGASELEGDGKPFCYRVADALIAAGVTMPAPRCPEWVRFGGKRINCQGSVGHEGECW